MNHQLLRERAKVIFDLICSTAAIYFHADTNEGQRGLYETLAGAGIWYLPGGVELYSGLISKEAYESVLKDPEKTKLVEEHSFPRKAGGRYLYEQYRKKGDAFTIDYFIDLYVKQLGRFNLVLKSENDKLKKFQKIKKGISTDEFNLFIDDIENSSYNQAGIKMCEFSKESYTSFKNMKYKKQKSNR